MLYAYQTSTIAGFIAGGLSADTTMRTEMIPKIAVSMAIEIQIEAERMCEEYNKAEDAKKASGGN